MTESKIQRLDRLDLDEVCEMIADGCSLAQIGVKFDRSRNVIWKFLHKTRNIGRLTWQLYKSEDSITPI